MKEVVDKGPVGFSRGALRERFICVCFFHAVSGVQECRQVGRLAGWGWRESVVPGRGEGRETE